MVQYIFNPQRHFRALKWQKPLVSSSLRFGIIFLAIAGISTANGYLMTQSVSMLGLSLIIAGLTLALLLARLYAWSSINQLPARSVATIRRGDNLADTLTFPLLLAVRSLASHDEPVTSSKLFLTLIKNDPALGDICARLEWPLATTASTLDQTSPQPQNLRYLIEQACILAQSQNRPSIRSGDVLESFLTQSHFQNFLRANRLQNKDIATVMHRYHALKDHQEANRPWWQPEKLLNGTGLGLSFAAGYTHFVDQFASLPSGRPWDVIDGHEQQLEQVITTLARERQSNVLLLGTPGVGTMGVIRELYDRVRRNAAHPALNGQRLLYLHLAQVVASSSSITEQQAAITRALNEMESAGNIIVVLDGISSILGGAGQLNVAETLTPFLSSSAIRSVTLVSPDDYRDYVQPQRDLLEYFEVVNVPPLNSDNTLKLLMRTIDAWEEKYNIFVPYRSLREVVTRTENLLPFNPFPEKAFDLLEEAMASEQGSGEGIITPSDIQKLISQKTNASVGDISTGESQRLLNLEEVMHERVINQRAAITAVSRAFIRARAGTRDPNKPIGTFLFLGPTGVGKTQTAKALAHAYFGNEKRLQRLDMTQFQGQSGTEQLLGTGRTPGQLTGLISDHPYSVLLLDEFEKADTFVQQLFLPVFDEGYISDPSGRKYSFANTILIATSNAGAEYIRQHVGDDGTVGGSLSQGLQEYILSNGIFTPELLNRFDGVITFTPLSRQHIQEVAALMLRQLNQRLDATHGITVAITPELTEFLTKIGYDPDFGARPMSRAIQNTVEYAIADQIARGVTRPGQAVVLETRYLQQLQEAVTA